MKDLSALAYSKFIVVLVAVKKRISDINVSNLLLLFSFLVGYLVNYLLQDKMYFSKKK